MSRSLRLSFRSFLRLAAALASSWAFVRAWVCPVEVVRVSGASSSSPSSLSEGEELAGEAWFGGRVSGWFDDSCCCERGGGECSSLSKRLCVALRESVGGVVEMSSSGVEEALGGWPGSLGLAFGDLSPFFSVLEAGECCPFSSDVGDNSCTGSLLCFGRVGITTITFW